MERRFKKNNELIRMEYLATRTGMDLITFCGAKIQYNQVNNLPIDNIVFGRKEFLEMIGWDTSLSMNKIHDRISVVENQMKFEERDSKHRTTFRLFPKVVSDFEEQTITFNINEDMSKMLLMMELQKNEANKNVKYTVIDMNITDRFNRRDRYVFRVYEILKMLSGLNKNGKTDLSEAELLRMLTLEVPKKEDKKKVFLRDFRNKILKKAIAEINLKSDINITYSYKKNKAKDIVGYDFIITPQELKNLDKVVVIEEVKPIELTEEEILKEQVKILERRLKEETEKRIKLEEKKVAKDKNKVYNVHKKTNFPIKPENNPISDSGLEKLNYKSRNFTERDTDYVALENELVGAAMGFDYESIESQLSGWD